MTQKAAVFLIHEAWEMGLIFTAPTPAEAHAKAEAHAEATFLDAYEPGDGGLGEGDTRSDREAWVQSCWEHGAFEIHDASFAEESE